MEKPFEYKKFLQYFLQGMLIMAPVSISVYTLYFVVSSIDGLIPIFSYIDETGKVRVQNYGLGFVVIIAAIILLGYFSSFFITSRIVSFMDKFLFIY